MEGLSDVRVGDFPRGNGTNAKTDRAGEGDLVRAQEGEPSQVEGVLQSERTEKSRRSLNATLLERVHAFQRGSTTQSRYIELTLQKALGIKTSYLGIYL